MILYICPGQDRQKHTTNHQRAEHVIWIVRLLCSVVHPKALCAWIWLVEGTKEAVCSPLTSVLLFAAALWCIEKLWQGYPSQTNAQEIPLLCIILNSSPPHSLQSFYSPEDLYFKLCASRLSVNCNGGIAFNHIAQRRGIDRASGACGSDTHHLSVWHCLLRRLDHYSILWPTTSIITIA